MFDPGYRMRLLKRSMTEHRTNVCMSARIRVKCVLYPRSLILAHIESRNEVSRTIDRA